jgi:hypothetical protein
MTSIDTETLAVILMCVVTAVLTFWGVHKFDRAAQNALSKQLDGLTVYAQPVPGSVAVIFHSYYGLLFYVSQTRHEFTLLPADAKELLSRLRSFNRSWTRYSPGALYVPALTEVEYRTQLRSISRQESALAEAPTFQQPVVPKGRKSTTLMYFFGLVAAGFVIATLNSLANRKYGDAVSHLVMVFVAIWLSRKTGARRE